MRKVSGGTLLCAVALFCLLWAGKVQSQALDEGTISLHVQTPVFTLDQEGLVVEGYEQEDRPGAPRLPVWTQLVELPSTGAWQVDYESVGEQQLVTDKLLPAVPGPDLRFDPTQLAALPGAIPMVDQPDPAIYEKDGWYPQQLVQAGGEQWMRGKRWLALRVYPFQYNPVDGTLRYHPDIRVTIRRMGAASAPSRHPEALIRTGRNPAASVSGGAESLRISTGERGFYRLTYAELQAAGVPVDMVDPRLFAMRYLGEPIAIQVTGEEDGRFDPGDLVIFYAEPYEGRYMTHNVYWFTYGGAPSPRVATRSVAPTGNEPVVDVITQTLHVEVDRIYMSTLARPPDQDHFYDNRLYPRAGAYTETVTYDLAVDDAVPAGTLALRTVAYGTFVGIPNSLHLRLNSHPVSTFQWDGMTEHTDLSSAPAAWLDGAPNQLTLEASLYHFPPDQRPPYYAVYPDWVEIRYPALADAEEDRLYIEGLAEGANKVKVTGFSTGEVRVYDLRDPLNPVELLTTQAGGDAFYFWDAPLPEPTYYLSTLSSLRAPLDIQFDMPSDWRTPQHSADYVVILHPLFWDAIQPLLDHRAAEALSVAKVDLQDVYDEFSYGRVDPEAIRAFLTYAYHNWSGGASPPEYVLLVGDGHFDFKRVLDRPEQPNLLPPYLANVDPWLVETAADNRFVSVDGPDDYLPDMHLGRVSARTIEELNNYISKVLAYETAAPGAWQREVVYVADNDADPAGNFHALSDEVRLNWLPPTYNDRTIYYNPDAPDPAYNTAEDMMEAITTTFNAGAFYVQWFGHASQSRWGSVRMFSINNLPGLEPNTVWPLSVSNACLSSMYTNLTSTAFYNYRYQALGEDLILTAQRGSVADIGPTGLHIGSALLTLNRGITQSLFQERMERVGSMLDASRLYFFANSSSWHDVIDTTLLLGDPAARLRLPPTPLDGSSMSVDDESPLAGQQVTFSVAMVNASGDPLADVALVVDYDQARMTINAAPGATNDGDTLTWVESSLPPGTTGRTFTATLDPALAPGTVIDTPADIRANRETVHLSQSVVIDVPNTPTPSHTPTLDPSVTPSATSSPSHTPTASATPSTTPTATATRTRLPTQTPSATAVASETPGPSPTATATRTPGPSPTATSTHTPGPSPTVTRTATPGPSPTTTATHTPGPSPTPTYTPTFGPSPTPTEPSGEADIFLPLVIR